MERAVGTRITLPDGRKAEVVENNSGICIGCALWDNIGMHCDFYATEQIGEECYNKLRTDHKNIIYKEIKED